MGTAAGRGSIRRRGGSGVRDKLVADGTKLRADFDGALERYAGARGSDASLSGVREYFERYADKPYALDGPMNAGGPDDAARPGDAPR